MGLGLGMGLGMVLGLGIGLGLGLGEGWVLYITTRIKASPWRENLKKTNPHPALTLLLIPTLTVKPTPSLTLTAPLTLKHYLLKNT